MAPMFHHLLHHLCRARQHLDAIWRIIPADLRTHYDTLTPRHQWQPDHSDPSYWQLHLYFDSTYGPTIITTGWLHYYTRPHSSYRHIGQGQHIMGIPGSSPGRGHFHGQLTSSTTQENDEAEAIHSFSVSSTFDDLVFGASDPFHSFFFSPIVLPLPHGSDSVDDTTCCSFSKNQCETTFHTSCCFSSSRTLGRSW